MTRFFAGLAAFAFLAVIAASGAGRDGRDWPTAAGRADAILDPHADQPHRTSAARGRLDCTTRAKPAASRPTRSSSTACCSRRTPKHRVVALDAATGTVRWTFDSGIEGRGPNRGVTYWAGGDEARIFTGQGSFALRARRAHGQADRRFRTRRTRSTCAKASAAIRRPSRCC